MPYIPNTLISQGGGGGGSVTLIEEIIAGAGGVASFDFQGIPNTFRHLRIEMQARAESGAGTDTLVIFNNDTTDGNYSWVRFHFFNGGQGGGSDLSAPNMNMSYTPGSDDTAGEASVSVIEIPYYAGTTFFKDCVSEVSSGLTNTSANLYRMSAAGRWADTDAIDQLTILMTGIDFAVGSSASLYGIS